MRSCNRCAASEAAAVVCAFNAFSEVFFNTEDQLINPAGQLPSVLERGKFPPLSMVGFVSSSCAGDVAAATT